MKENFIQVKEDNIQRFRFKDKFGKETNCVLEFDMEDIEMPLKINKSNFEHKKNMQWIKNQFVIIEKKDNGKQEGLISWKQAQQINAMKEFYKREIEILDLVIGEGKTNEILKDVMHRKPYYSMFEDINELLKPIIPLLKNATDDVINKVKEKYGKVEQSDVLE